VGGLYRPTGEFYGRRRGLAREPGRGLIRRGEYGPGGELGGELGGFDGWWRELERPARELGGPARGGELSRGLIPGGELGRFDG